MAPHDNTELRGMNAFHLARPRGADAPAKLPVQRKKAVPITVRGTTRVMNARGVWQAKLNPNASNNIVIEGAEQGRASSDKRRRISPSGTK
jgi:hypothetical protein